MFKKKRTIDIIMPNYNKGQFIVEAINSVIKQTYKNWRLLSLMTIQQMSPKKT